MTKIILTFISFCLLISLANAAPFSCSINGDTITVTDEATNTIISQFVWHSLPHLNQALVTLDGSKIYAFSYNDNHVHIINAATGVIIKEISVSMPWNFVLSPDGRRVYVISADAWESSFTAIDTSSDEIIKQFSVGHGSNGVSVTADNKYIIVYNQGETDFNRQYCIIDAVTFDYNFQSTDSIPNEVDVPEFPSLALPVAAMLGLLAVIFGRKKNVV